MSDWYEPLKNELSALEASVSGEGVDTSSLDINEVLAARYQTLLIHNCWLSELGETTAAMLQHESVDTLLQHIARELVNVSCANGAYMHMVHETGDHLDVLAAFGPLSDTLIGAKRFYGIGLSAKVWATGVAQYVEDYNNHPDCVLELDSEIQAVSLPLTFAGEVLGVVFVTAEKGQPLQEDVDLLKQVAVIASLSIHHARQRESVSRELFRSKSLSQISAAMYEIQDWDDLALHVCPKLFDALDLSRVSLYNVEQENQTLHAYASWSRKNDEVVLSESISSELINETVSRWCFENKLPAQINRTIEDPRESTKIHAFRREKNIGSTLCVPVMANAKVRGMLVVCRSFDKRDFDENDVNTVHTVIGQLSTALQRHELLREVQYQAVHDSLTGLPNRRGFEDFLSDLLSESADSETLKAVLFFDLDGFKDINDTYGHAAGDAVLQQVAQRLTDCKNESDMLSRLGGDEFAVVLPSIPRLREAVERAANFAESFTDAFLVDGVKVSLGVSIGISFYPRDGVTMDDLIRHADMAMYQAKSKGRNRIVSFDHAHAITLREEQSSIKDLHKAVSDQEFDLWYQPQISLSSGLVNGVEALIRWQHPTRGILPPTKFIPLAEELGLISMVGTWVLEKGCQQMVDWQHLDPVPWHLGINVAGPQLMSKGFAGAVLKILEAYDIGPDQLQLEVPESVLTNDLASVSGNFQLLRSNGVRIAVDDFGAGYSSLQYSGDLPLDVLKIDRSFVRKLSGGAKLKELSDTIDLLKSRFDLVTVAEGVETLEQLNFVKQLNCDLVQGFYFAKPVTAADLPELVSELNQSDLIQKKVA